MIRGEEAGADRDHGRFAPHPKLILRPGSPMIAERFRSGTVVINHTTPRGYTIGLRHAIARLTPQVPRFW